MTSLSAIGLGQGDLSIEEVSLSPPAPDEVIVKMKAAGICHTDYDSLSWGKPVVMGHEGAGIIHALGSQVSAYEIGDAVILNWATPCLSCFQCQLGNQHLCEENSPVVAGGNGYTPGHAQLESTRWRGKPIERSFNLGTLSEYALVKASALVKIEQEQFQFPTAAIVSCGVMTGYGSVIHAAKLQAGSSAAVLGCGGVGLNVIQACQLAGATRIVAIDINPHKLELARQFGATDTILASPDDVGLLAAARQLKSMLGGRGSDYAFECTAIPALGAAPLAMIRDAGTAVQVSGIEQDITIDMRLFEWDKIYINPLYGKCRPAIDFPKIMALNAAGKLQLDDLVTATYPLDHIDTAIADMLAGKNAKGVIVFDS
ncbi:MAG: Zn-dependent alcohol dehydrogenase [Bacteroidota bacterium]